VTTDPRILITGEQGLAAALCRALHSHQVSTVSRRQGTHIKDVSQWGHEFLTHDIVINNAYDSWHQIAVLEFFAQHWQHDRSKMIVTIGSMVTDYARVEMHKDSQYWPYREHKIALQRCFQHLVSQCVCDIKLINPGPIDTDMISHLDCAKMDPDWLALIIKDIMQQPAIKRIDLWQ
jgi:hypothetical protein